MTTFHTERSPENGPQASGLAKENLPEQAGSASISVRALAPFPPPRTVARYQNGISLQEARRLSAAAHFMKARGPVIFISLASSGDDTRISVNGLTGSEITW